MFAVYWGMCSQENKYMFSDPWQVSNKCKSSTERDRYYSHWNLAGSFRPLIPRNVKMDRLASTVGDTETWTHRGGVMYTYTSCLINTYST